MKTVQIEVIGNNGHVFDFNRELAVYPSLLVRDAVAQLKRDLGMHWCRFGLFEIMLKPSGKMLGDDENLYAVVGNGQELFAVMVPWI